jgi:hypothetical protein
LTLGELWFTLKHIEFKKNGKYQEAPGKEAEVPKRNDRTFINVTVDENFIDEYKIDKIIDNEEIVEKFYNYFRKIDESKNIEVSRKNEKSF